MLFQLSKSEPFSLRIDILLLKDFIFNRWESRALFQSKILNKIYVYGQPEYYGRWTVHQEEHWTTYFKDSGNPISFVHSLFKIHLFHLIHLIQS